MTIEVNSVHAPPPSLLETVKNPLLPSFLLLQCFYLPLEYSTN